MTKSKKRASKKTTKKVEKKITKKTVKKSVKKIYKKPSRRSGLVKKTKSKKIAVKKKKVIIKKKLANKKGKKILVIAIGDSCFWVNYGPALRDLLELRNALHEISEDQFKHHVNAIRNDFAEWVGDVLKDKKTAVQIKKTKTVHAMKKAVEKALKDYRY